MPSLFLLLLIPWLHAQPTHLPRFEDYPAKDIFSGIPASPILNTPQKREYRTKIQEGIMKGWGVEDGVTGKELAKPGANFAGHYVIIRWGCGSPCLMAAIVDLKTGYVYPPPYHHGPTHSYFQVPWDEPTHEALEYRLNSRLLIAHICEDSKMLREGDSFTLQPEKCGVHYFLVGDDGFRLIHRILKN